ncbi:nitroreductase family protein [Candidatus Bipolaricaulota bacterium]|nr:nitroreductase family protein [Candidatus Bipolaricaulota bacterium]
MNFFDLIKKRSSIRAYKERPVSEEQVEKLLNAANSAPSAGNLQSYKILVIRSEEVREKLVKAAHGQKFLSQAPVVFAFLQDKERSRDKYGDRGEFYSLQDGTIAATYLQLAAVELGLGSCWIGAFDDEAVIDALPSSKRPLALLPVGYPARTSRNDSVRRELEEIAEFIE